jgi:hypothetical protein
MASSAARRARRNAEKAAREKEQAPAVPKPQAPAPKPVQPVLAAVPEPEPEPEAQELNFMVPPGDLLLPEGVYPADKQKPLVVDYALDAHWQQFRGRNPDLRIFQKTMRAMMRVLMREEHAAVEAARAEVRRTGVPVRPQVPPLLKAIREELRQMKAEESGAIFDD